MTVNITEKLKSKIGITGSVNKRMLLRLAAAIAGACLVIFAQPLVISAGTAIMGQAALFSAAITMPRSALQSLSDRFAGDTLEPPPSSSEVCELPPTSAALPPVSSAPPPSSQSAPQSRPPVGKPPEIPESYRGPLVTLTMAGEENNPAFYNKNSLWLRNYTKLSIDKIDAVLDTPSALELGTADAPQVLIYHTHTTESYEKFDNNVYDTRNTWRDTDNNNNMAAAGELLARELEKRGISVLHDTTQHDYPSYNGAYDRSYKTVKKYLEEYPSIKVTIDLHRDGIIQADDTVLKPVVEVDGKPAAQLMIIVPCDDGSVGVPGWRQNLRFAAELQTEIENDVPGLCRPIFFCYRNYNLGLTDNSLLFELGTNGNTLEEALYTAQLIAEPIARILTSHMPT